MSRKPKSKKNNRRSATRLNGDQSLRFLNAITGYSEEAGVSMDKIAKDCDIPLSLMQKWFSRLFRSQVLSTSSIRSDSAPTLVSVVMRLSVYQR